MFNFTKKLDEKEYEYVLKRLTEIASRVESLELRADDLRNDVLRKIQSKIKKEAPENISTIDGLPRIGINEHLSK